MPPKTFKRQPVVPPSQASQKSKDKEDSPIEDNHKTQDLFINPKNIQTNKKAFDKMRLLTTILAGVVSGLLNLTQLMGPFLYLLAHLLLTLFIFVKIGKPEGYFKTSSSLFEGMGGGVLLFICIWMIVVNIVYVL